MLIEVSAPARVDLAGGTLDIHPLYVFEDGGITVNIAIELRSYVEIETRSDKKINVRSVDLNKEVSFNSLSEIKFGTPLDFILRILRFYSPSCGVDITTRNTTPLGSGLGASSSLLIALSTGLNELRGKKFSKKEIIDIGANIEAQEIEIPTGKQDYYAATYGGINAIWFNLDKNIVEKLVVKEKFIRELENRIILSFTGVSHFSGTNNWNMLKRYIDNKGTTRKNMKRIKQTALKMREALLNSDFSLISEALAEEWENRKNLAKGVSNAKIERLMKAAKEVGAEASKICGAGGGGCMITIAKEGAKNRIEENLRKNGAEILDFKIARRGCIIRKHNL
jgi:D-glycero-alpha-D-manno-heptose-7-phosphate kinase